MPRLKNREGNVECKEIYAASLFIDSGAFGLYATQVLKHGTPLEGKHGRELERPAVRWGEGDFSHYDLLPGSAFRRYCDSYAALMKKVQPLGVLCANVDVISNPKLTWVVQQYFEQEHGVRPIPVVHFGTPMSWVDRYVAGGHTLMGTGGLGHKIRREEYYGWADVLFTHLCPASNNYLPLIRVHGFAMTSWELMCRYPWWSVDSTTWIKVAAYGGIYVPRWGHEREDWRWDEAPLVMSVSAGSPSQKQAGQHYEYGKAAPALKETVDLWLKKVKVPLGSVDVRGEMQEYGVCSHYRARAIANLRYLKMFEQSRPKWPHPLDPRIIEQHAVKYQKGFGL